MPRHFLRTGDPAPPGQAEVRHLAENRRHAQKALPAWPLERAAWPR